MTDHTDLVDELAAVGREAVQRGLVLASGGNLSARHPGGKEFVVTRAGSWLDRLGPEDFVSMTLDGEPVGAGRAQPSSEWKLHQRTYLVREDINAVVHVHPQHAVLIHALGKPFTLLTLDHAFYIRSVGEVGYHPNGSDELADAAAAAAREHDCIVLAHHGCSALGPNVEMAFRRALNLEEAAVMTYRCLLLGNESLSFPPDAFAALHHH